MDIPLATNYTGILQGFKTYKRKPSTFCHQADVDGFSAFVEAFFEKKSNVWLR